MSYTKRYMESCLNEELYDFNSDELDYEYERWKKLREQQLEEEQSAYEEMLADSASFITLA